MQNARECPKCGNEGAAYDSRDDDRGRYRLRKCKSCGTRWKTYEVIESDLVTLQNAKIELKKLKARILRIEKFETILKQIKSL